LSTVGAYFLRVYGTGVQPLRERKKAHTREAIELATLRLFEVQGYDTTTVEQIAEAAEVSVRTFYRYFDSKDAVIFARFDNYLDAYRQEIRGRDRDGDPVTSLITASEAFASQLELERDFLLAFYHLVGSNQALLLRSLQDHLRWQIKMAEELARDAGVGPDDLRIAVLAGAMGAGFRSGLTVWQQSGGRTELRTEVGRALSVAFGLHDAIRSLWPATDRVGSEI
jgi:AcrR family transcriptional regulator